MTKSPTPQADRTWWEGRHSPPWYADPRRTTCLIPLIASLVFVFSYADAVSAPFAVTTRTLVIALVLTSLFCMFVKRSWLGPFQPATARGIVIYLLCVAGEIGLIAAGSRWLDARGEGELRPALIAAVVGLHFIPFAWAFKERMFYWLGSALLLTGLVGLASAQGSWALASATLSGLLMAALTLAYARGTFATSPPPPMSYLDRTT